MVPRMDLQAQMTEQKCVHLVRRFVANIQDRHHRPRRIRHHPSQDSNRQHFRQLFLGFRRYFLLGYFSLFGPKTLLI